MKINEVEQLLNITKPNIRFYEKKGLFSPARNENGYREYSKEDIEILKKIILFRKMGISIEDIKALLDGEEKLSKVVNKNVVRIEEQMKELQGALHISQRMQKDQQLDQCHLDKMTIQDLSVRNNTEVFFYNKRLTSK
jgi:DNA-binding transcriptional MerR regulator